MKKFLLLMMIVFAAFFAKAQQTERLPVMATPEEKLLNQQLEKRAKSERPLSLTPWLLSRTQTTSTQNLAPTNVLVNNNNGATATSQFTQSETTILAYGNNVITGFNDAGSRSGGANRFTGYSYSTDGGLTFTDGGNLPVNAGGDAGDPVLARNNTTGRIYFSTLGFSISTIQLFRSDDNGLTWLPPVNATPGGSSEDKQWMAVDNYAGAGNGNLYLMSRRFSGAVGIYFHRSTDDGSTFSAGIQLFNGGQGAFIEVDPAHNIYAFYINGAGQILMRKSTDQGLTFAAAVTVATGLGGSNGDLALTGLRQGTVSYASFRSNSFPHVAINPVSGHIYVTYNNNPAGVDKGDVFMTMSTDGGATWSAAVRVNDDLTTTDQWQPTIAVSPDGANLGIFYYSRQEDPINNNLFKYYCRTAAISGATVTFRPSGPVSDVAAVPEFGRDAVVNSTYMGDYQQAAATATGFYVSWADSRSDLAIGPPRKDPNVYFAKVPLEGVAGTSVLTSTTAPVISGGNGNATIDANECNSISISLTNVGSATAQSISAVITSSTPGVVITQGSSAYPDIAPAAAASNTTLFKIATSTGYVCGTNIQLTLTVTSSDGTVVFNLVLPATTLFGPAVSFSNNTVTPIPDVTTTNIPIAVSGITTAIGKVTISLHLLHTFDSDLDISLIGPDGTTVDLSSDNGGAGENFGTSCDPVTNRTTFDDAGVSSIIAGSAPFVGTFIPEQSLSLFNGKSGLDVNGTWILRIVDDLGGDVGTFNCVTLNIAANLPCDNDGAPITCPANITNAVNPVTYTVGTNSSGPVTLSYVFSGATHDFGSGTGSGSTFNTGITIVTVTSSNGCIASSCTFTVEVVCTPPVITAPTVTQPTCATPTGTIIVNATGTGALEYSVNNGTTWQPSATFSGLATGNYFIIVRSISDPTCSNAYSGNPVVLNPAPTSDLTCPANMVVTITDVICFKAVSTPNPTICGTLTKLTWKLTGATVLSSPTTGINYLGLRNMNVGTTTVTYTATFTGGVIKTCSFTVLVIETIPPNILCPLDKQVNTDAGKCYKTGPVSLGTPTTSDNCGVVSVTNNAPAVYNIGVNYVTWTVTDKSGNTRTCVQRVTVKDVERPTITCPANVIANTGPVCNATPVTLAPPVFSDNCRVKTVTWAMTGVTWGSSANMGINFVPTMNYATGVSTIIYTVVDVSGNARTCTFTVTVKDVTPPTLVCPVAQTFCKVANNTYTIPVLVQSDNCVIASTNFAITGATSRSGSGTNASGIFNLGVSTIKWTVKDVAGNTSTCSTTITVLATTDPACTLLPLTGPGAITKYTEPLVPGLSVTAWPNPTVNFFNLKVNSPDKEMVLIRMFDMAGKLVQARRGVPGETYIVGEGAGSGTYIIEVSQGTKKQMVKLVKRN